MKQPAAGQLQLDCSDAIYDFHFLAALTQEGIDGARIALDRIRANARGESRRSLDLVATKLDEAELWLGRAIECEAKQA